MKSHPGNLLLASLIVLNAEARAAKTNASFMLGPAFSAGAQGPMTRNRQPFTGHQP